MKDSAETFSERSSEQLRTHYEIEKGLAQRLRQATKAKRLELYRTIYDELYARVPDHPMLTRKVTPEQTANRVQVELTYLRRFLRPETRFMEVGAGDCAVTLGVAPLVKKAYGLEVSKLISASASVPENFELIISDGTNIPLPPESVDLVYSNQLMEHLHPDDAVEQLRNIYNVLSSSGIYICVTPHRIQGPTDISSLYDEVASGLHLKEYTYSELDKLFASAGFKRRAAYVTKGGKHKVISVRAMKVFESFARLLFGGLPYDARQAWISRKPFTLFRQGITIIGYK